MRRVRKAARRTPPTVDSRGNASGELWSVGLKRLLGPVTLICVTWALGACGSCGTPTATGAQTPTQSELAASTVSGKWTLTVAVASYSGPPPPKTNRFHVGHTGTDTVTFVSRCAGASCTLVLWGPTGPDPTQSDYFRFYSDTTGLEGPPVSMPMTESGATYSQTIPIAGFGGYTCPPSSTVPKPEQRLSLTVTGASSSASGWIATAMTGKESLLFGWGCGAAGFTGWTVGNLTISGRPATI